MRRVGLLWQLSFPGRQPSLRLSGPRRSSSRRRGPSPLRRGERLDNRAKVAPTDMGARPAQALPSPRRGHFRRGGGCWAPPGGCAVRTPGVDVWTAISALSSRQMSALIFTHDQPHVSDPVCPRQTACPSDAGLLLPAPGAAHAQPHVLPINVLPPPAQQAQPPPPRPGGRRLLPRAFPELLTRPPLCLLVAVLPAGALKGTVGVTE